MTRLIGRYAARGKLLVVVTGLMVSALLIIAACGGTSGAAAPEAAPTFNQQVGISVSARGEVVTTPDLVMLNAGVESRADTVETARAQAAQGMDRMIQVLNGRGIQSADIQTRFFSISPDYVWDDMTREQKLVGYVVNNQVSVKIRDMDSVGVIIDDLATAGGDLVRINGVNFTVENPEALESQAREKAIEVLTAKARQFAQLMGVQLGPPISLTEGGGFAPRGADFYAYSMSEALATPAAPATSISGGELTVSVSVSGVFSFTTE